MKLRVEIDLDGTYPEYVVSVVAIGPRTIAAGAGATLPVAMARAAASCDHGVSHEMITARHIIACCAGTLLPEASA